MSRKTIDFEGLDYVEDRRSSLQVVIRVRPPIPREYSYHFRNTVAIDSRQRHITISDNIAAFLAGSSGTSNSLAFGFHSYTFDRVFDQISSQDEVYDNAVRDIVDSALQGYNATVLAYGEK